MRISLPALYWAAGFLEGEGAFNAFDTARIYVSQVQLWPLAKLHQMFGGNIFQRKTAQHNHHRAWVWQLTGVRAAGLMMTIFPLVSPKLRQKIQKALTKYMSRGKCVRMRTPLPNNSLEVVHGSSALNWIAGFLEGEGSFVYAGTRAVVQADQVQVWPLQKLQVTLGGRLQTIAQKHEKWSPKTVWVIDGRHAAGLMMTLSPLMSPKRQTQIRAALSTWRAHPPHHAYKSQCIHGHAFDAENTVMRYYSDRKPARRCRACDEARNAARNVVRRAAREVHRLSQEVLAS